MLKLEDAKNGGRHLHLVAAVQPVKERCPSCLKRAFGRLVPIDEDATKVVCDKCDYFQAFKHECGIRFI